MGFLKTFKEWSRGRDPSFATTSCKFYASYFPLLLVCCAALYALLPQFWWYIVFIVCPLIPVLAEDSAQSFGSGCSGWILRKNSILKDWLSIGTSSPGKWRRHHSYKCPKNEKRWQFAIRFSGKSGIWWKVELDDLGILSNLNDSMIHLPRGWHNPKIIAILCRILPYALK